MGRQKRGVISIGLLTDDLGCVSRRVLDELVYRECVAWTSDGCWYVAQSVEEPKVPLCMMAGTFCLGESLDALNADLACLRDSLQSIGMLDDGALPPVNHGRFRATPLGRSA
jgi:hypothetical protein